MTEYLGIDVGDKRVGVAFLNAEVGIAFPQKPLARQEALHKLTLLVSERQVSIIIVGLPLTAEGKMTPQAQKVKKFIGQIQSAGLGVDIRYVDEHLSSEDASERLREAGKSVQDARRSGELDCLVAALLLEGYIRGEIPEVY